MVPAGGMCVAGPADGMRGVRPHRPPTTLDVLDHVLGKGVVIDAHRDTSDTRSEVSVVGLGLFGVDTHVEVTDVDPDARARSRPLR